MGSHDEYGKEVLRRAASAQVQDWGSPVERLIIPVVVPRELMLL
jgi:hypothetical protein